LFPESGKFFSDWFLKLFISVFVLFPFLAACQASPFYVKLAISTNLEIIYRTHLSAKNCRYQMARKKRIQQPEALPGTQTKEPARYQDAFQQKAGKGIEEVSKRVEGRGRTILYALGAVAVLLVLIGIFYAWNRRSNAEAQAALGRAIEISQAPVTTIPIPAGSTQRAFKTERERAEASIREFQVVVDKYGSPYREKAQYFIAVNRLSQDRGAAIQELENLSKASGEVGTLSKFALAQAYQGDGKLDEAARLYNELAQMSDPILAKDTINFALASIYEKQGKKAEAAELYFKIADAASKAKDLDGKPIPLSLTAREAKEKLEALDPAKAAEIKEAPLELPEGLKVP
jgi:tetratricopeptide (TPR) repeat protein